MTILENYRKKKQEEELVRAYDEYEDFRREDNKGGWGSYEIASLKDIGRSLKRK